MKESKIISLLIPLSFLFYLAVNIISWNFPFFWDSLLTSSIVMEFYEKGINGFIISDKLDAGHPPLFYMYLLGWWKIAQPSLTISHLAMLPFLWVMVYQFIRVSGYFIKKPIFIGCSTLLFLVDPTIIAQSSMVSYDIVLAMLYFTVLRSILLKRNELIIFASMLLPLLSIRGSFAVAALMVTHLLIDFIYNKKINFKKILLYVPAMAVIILWHSYHYFKTGWFFFSESENWSGQRTFGTVDVVFHNILTIIRNIGDYGRFGVYISILVLAGLWYIQKRKISNDLKVLVAITIIPLIVFSFLFIPFSNPIGHRYYLFFYMLTFILFGYLLSYFKNGIVLFAIAFALLISGNFWVHSKISNGWDSTLAHVPYFKLKVNMDEYIKKKNIDKLDIGTRFPLYVNEKQAYLFGDTTKMEFLGDTTDFEYILYSNISNEWTDSDMNKISKMDTLLHLEKGNIYIMLFQKRDKSL